MVSIKTSQTLELEGILSNTRDLGRHNSGSELKFQNSLSVSVSSHHPNTVTIVTD